MNYLEQNIQKYYANEIKLYIMNIPVYKLRKHIRVMKARMNHHKSIGGKVGYFQNQIKIAEEKLLKLY